MFRFCPQRDARARDHRRRPPEARRAALGRKSGQPCRKGRPLTLGLSEFLVNERLVAALRGALRTQRVPHALLFTGPRGVGKYTLARMFAQAASCERLTDDFCGECATCLRIAQLADPQALIERALAERGESADAAAVERMPLLLQPHPDVCVVAPDPIRL